MNTDIRQLFSYDWQCAFEYAGDDSASRAALASPNVSTCIGSTAPASDVLRSEVKRIIWISEGENDGRDWLIVTEQNDGRFAFLCAGCDYTGWDCQASGHCIVSHDLNHLVQYGLTDDARARFGIK